MAVVTFRKSGQAGGSVAQLIRGWSIEVMPRTAAKVESFRAILAEAKVA